MTTGVIFLVLNYLLGWPTLLAIESAAAVSQSKSLALLGAVVYGLSWILLGLGLWLAGPQSVAWTKSIVQRWWGRQRNING